MLSNLLIFGGARNASITPLTDRKKQSFSDIAR
jgi:hypothetical protein